MERMIMNRDGLTALVNSVGCRLSDTFIIAEDCQESLEQLWQRLEGEDPCRLEVRRQLGLLSFVPRVLVPLLEVLYAEDNSDLEDRPAIYCLALKLLVYLSEPLSSLRQESPELDAALRQSASCASGSALAAEMERLYSELSAEFLRPEPHQALLQPIHNAIHANETGLVEEDVMDAVNCVLYLYRNLLAETSALHIVVMMLSCGMEEFLQCVYAMKNVERWGVALAQVLPLLYRDKCNLFAPLPFAEKTITGSTFRDPKAAADMVVEAMSDEHSSDDEQTMVTNSDAASISSDKEGSMSLPTKTFQVIEDRLDENLLLLFIRKKLSDMAEAFLSTCFADLVLWLQTQSLVGGPAKLSPFYTTWLLKYFLNFALKNRMPFSTIRDVVDVDVVGHLVFALYQHQEALLVLQHQESLMPEQAQHLQQQRDNETELMAQELEGLVAILRCIHGFQKERETEESIDYISCLKLHLVEMNNLSEVFPMLLQNIQADQPSALLHPLILANHLVLKLIANVKPPQYDMVPHLQLFATPGIMHAYLSCLQDVESCPKEVLDAMFIMLHHVVNDMRHRDCLLHWPILNILNSLDDEKAFFKLEVEHIDLVNNVLRQFISEEDDDEKLEVDSPPDSPVRCQSPAISDDLLTQLFELINKNTLSAETFTTFIKDTGINKTPIELLTELLSVGILSEENFKRILQEAPDNSLMQALNLLMDEDGEEDEEDEEKEVSLESAIAGVKEFCRDEHVQWLQRELMEACYVLAGGRDLDKPYPEEPVLLKCFLLNAPLPLVAFTHEQREALADAAMCRLLDAAGITAPAPGAARRFPAAWAPDTYYGLMRQLGPIDHLKAKVEESDFLEQMMTRLQVPPDPPYRATRARDFAQDLDDNMWPQMIQSFNSSLTVK